MTDMVRLDKTLRIALADRKGVTALEYGLIAAMIAAVIVGAVATLGTTLSGVFTSITGSF